MSLSAKCSRVSARRDELEHRISTKLCADVRNRSIAVEHIGEPGAWLTKCLTCGQRKECDPLHATGERFRALRKQTITDRARQQEPTYPTLSIDEPGPYARDATVTATRLPRDTLNSPPL